MAIALVPAIALAHTERASYWPDAGVETVDGQPTGGAVPTVRGLFSALDESAVGDTRVVCQELPTQEQQGGSGGPQGAPSPAPQTTKKSKPKKKKKKKKKKGARRVPHYSQVQLAAAADHPSIQRLNASLADAVANGYVIRPSQPRVQVNQAEADQLRAFNLQLLAECGYTSIQAAVNDSGNNDRIVVMPGVYTEPASRAAPIHDPTCEDLKEENDKGQTGAVSYRYQFHCPNDQNLIAVLGRAPATDENGDEVAPPQPPLEDRHDIPDEGPCIRCNLQIEGSGVSPDDVVVDGGDPSMGDNIPPDADQHNYAKDVGIRVDRADGFVLTNLKVRHFNEHSIYVIEADGFNLSHFKATAAGEYAVLTFVADHSLTADCDTWGSGDAAIYPGASADTWDAVGDPDDRRRSNEIRNCDMRHSALGFSGTDANAVWLHHNEIYDNSQGFSVDVFTAPGHPGFPQDSVLLEHNNIYSNNFNTYLPGCGAGESPGPQGPNQNCTDVASTVPVPVGVGMWVAGGNHNIVRNNHFYDNWRRAAMVFAVPDQLVCGPLGIDPTLVAGCNPAAAPPSTSYNNEFHHNVMGQRPDGTPAPNGTDFWWDDFAGNTGNCWHDNGTYTSSPPPSPESGASLPGFLPEDCASSTGTGTAPQNEAELVACLASVSMGDDSPDQPNCTWYDTPPKP